MDLKDVADQMRQTAKKHPLTPVSDGQINLPNVDCIRVLTLDGCEIEVMFTWTQLPIGTTSAIPDPAFWHLTMTPKNGKPIPDQIANELVVCFLDTSREVMELPADLMSEIWESSPGQRQYSQLETPLQIQLGNEHEQPRP